MKLPPFNYAEMEWDGWRAFHVSHGYSKFVQFDTGEFVVCSRRWSPEKRCPHDEFHLQIVATDDETCPRLYIPGTLIPGTSKLKPVPKSHLNHGGHQVLLLDHDHKRAVSIDSWLTKDNAPEPIPERFIDDRNVSAYYAGPKAMPVGSPIARHFPCALSPDQRDRINDLRIACEVWLKMQADPEALKKQHRAVEAPLVRDFINVSFATLIPSHRTAIALHGFNMIVRETTPWLTFDGKQYDKEETDDD